MLLWLGSERAAEKRLERQSVPKRSAEIGLLVTEKTGAEPSIRGEPHPIAAPAVCMRHRCDDTDSASGPWKREISRRAVSPRWAGNRSDGRDGLQSTKNLIRWNDMIPGEVAHLSDGHQLDKPYVPRTIEGQPRKIADLVIIDPSHHDDVDLDWRESRIFGSERGGDWIEVGGSP